MSNWNTIQKQRAPSFSPERPAYLYNKRTVPIYNTRKNITNLKPTGVHLYGKNKNTRKYIVNKGNKKGVHVDPENLSIANPPKHTPCNRCKRIGYEHTQNELMSAVPQSLINELHPNNYVEQNTWQLQHKNVPLYTYGLATCTALQFTLGSKKFLAHLSSETDVAPIVKDILQKTPTATHIKNIQFSCGTGGNACDTVELYEPSKTSYEKAKLILRSLRKHGKILDGPIKKEDVCYAEIVRA